MPVEGALLQHWLYRDPAERPLTDVDVFLRPETFELAIARLEASGYRRLGRSSIGAIVMKTPMGLALDLHPRPFERARLRLPTEKLFPRSCED